MTLQTARIACLVLSLLFGDRAALCRAVESGAQIYVKQATWPETLLAARTALKSAALPEATRATWLLRLWEQFTDDFPVQAAWTLQDFGPGFPNWFSHDTSIGFERTLNSLVLEELGEQGAGLRNEFDLLCKAAAAPNDARWLKLYAQACEQRRALRLKTVHAQAPRILFTKRRTIRPSFFAYTEGQSEAQNERHFLPGAELCLLEMDELCGRVRTLLADPTGVIRDPAVSWDAQRVLFAWKKSLDGDDYHL